MTMTDEDKLMSQRVYFIVQYSPEGLRDYDEIVEFKCDYPPVQFREFTADLETQRLDPSLLPHGTWTDTSENFVYKLLDEEMRPLPSESVVNVGDILFFQISLTETSGLADMIVKRCTLLDSHSREEAKYFTDLLDQSGCVLPPLGMSINNQGKSVTLGFRVIRYTFSPVLYINCQVSGCVPTTLNDVDRAVGLRDKRGWQARTPIQIISLTTSLHIFECGSAIRKHSKTLSHGRVILTFVRKQQSSGSF
ncbi:uncharacterized protein LOC112557193 [Pomacea canaliculata]|uniref:uncharacterized protein LOC112557193 n=1 Tax=Pomacea canaliculata TaxID=400727 RepID=UPI000D73C396|nr:uncharacterized protein LOC112557193 [Pomacea canaliculata]